MGDGGRRQGHARQNLRIGLGNNLPLIELDDAVGESETLVIVHALSPPTQLRPTEDSEPNRPRASSHADACF